MFCECSKDMLMKCNGHESLKGHETEVCEIASFAGNIQEMVLSQELQGCLLKLKYSISNR